MKITLPGLLFLIYCIHRCFVVPLVMMKILREQKRGPSSASARKTYVPSMIMTIGFGGLALLVSILSSIPVIGSNRIDLKTIPLALAFLILNLFNCILYGALVKAEPAHESTKPLRPLLEGRHDRTLCF